jgi:hypothetical protein
VVSTSFRAGADVVVRAVVTLERDRGVVEGRRGGVTLGLTFDHPGIATAKLAEQRGLVVVDVPL